MHCQHNVLIISQTSSIQYSIHRSHKTHNLTIPQHKHKKQMLDWWTKQNNDNAYIQPLWWIGDTIFH
jgi:hypothetical protein